MSASTLISFSRPSRIPANFTSLMIALLSLSFGNDRATAATTAVPPGDWWSLADFAKSPLDKDLFIERGGREFTTVEDSGMVYCPVNFGSYTIIYAPEGRVATVRDKIVMMEFSLPDDTCSMGLHLKGKGLPDEDDLSYLILVKRLTPDLGAVSVYRCNVWASDGLQPDQLVGTAKNIHNFSSADQHSLTVSTSWKPDVAETIITVTVKAINQHNPLLVYDTYDNKPPLLEPGSVAARFYAAPNKRVILKSLSARSPKP